MSFGIKSPGLISELCHLLPLLVSKLLNVSKPQSPHLNNDNRNFFRAVLQNTQKLFNNWQPRVHLESCFHQQEQCTQPCPSPKITHAESMLELKEVCVVSRSLSPQLFQNWHYHMSTELQKRWKGADLKSHHIHTSPFCAAHGHEGICMCEEILRRMFIFVSKFVLDSLWQEL